MNRSAFYAALRERGNKMFGTSLGQRQVDGLEALLTALRGFPLDHAAHVLAECYHETGGGMYPVKETVYSYSRDKNPSDEKVIARLDAAWRKGKLPWVKTPYWREGWFGRGQIQLTHRYNYSKAAALTGYDLLGNRDLTLDPKVSAEIAAEGCRVGMFTGKKLADFDRTDGYDHINARAIVNGDKHVNGPKVAKYAEAFTEALEAAGWGVLPPVMPDVEPLDPKPSSVWVRLISAIIGAFRK